MATTNPEDVLFEMYRGDDYTLRVTFTNPTTGNPVDITGWSFKSTMKLNTILEDDEASVSVDIPAQSGVTAEGGILYISYPHEQTLNLDAAEYFVDLQKEVGGRISTLFVKKAIVKGDVTRRIG